MDYIHSIKEIAEGRKKRMSTGDNLEKVRKKKESIANDEIFSISFNLCTENDFK